MKVLTNHSRTNAVTAVLTAYIITLAATVAIFSDFETMLIKSQTLLPFLSMLIFFI